jgi:hypothetical protein
MVRHRKGGGRLVRKALALLVMVTVVGVVLGVVGLLHPNTVDAQAPSATRSFSGITSVSAGGELSVMITAREYGSPGRVEETLPDGFSYVDGSTVPGPEDIRVTTVVGDDGRTTVRFTLDGEEEFTYKVTASSTEGNYSFSGILKDEDRAPHQIRGDSMITVGALLFLGRKISGLLRLPVTTVEQRSGSPWTSQRNRTLHLRVPAPRGPFRE